MSTVIPVEVRTRCTLASALVIGEGFCGLGKTAYWPATDFTWSIRIVLPLLVCGVR